MWAPAVFAGCVPKSTGCVTMDLELVDGPQGAIWTILVRGREWP